MSRRVLGPRDRRDLLAAIKAGRVYRTAAGHTFRRMGGEVHGRNPLKVMVAPRLIDELTTAGAICLEDTGVYRITHCSWCLEDWGWCATTGGPNPCEGQDDAAELVVEAAEAPRVPRPIKAGVL